MLRSDESLCKAAGTCVLRFTWCVAALTMLAALSASAQDSTESRKWITSGSVGIPGVGSEAEPSAVIIGMQWTRVARAGIAPDIGLGMLPRALTSGVLAFGGRAGAALPLAMESGMTLLPSAGLSAIGAVGQGGGAGTWGYYAGGSLVVLGTRGIGARFGATWHRFNSLNGGAIWLLEFGIARGPRPRTSAK